MAADPRVLRPVPKATLSEHVYERLREAILRGELLPGDRIVEHRLARELSVSQGPVREALQRLTLEGIVTSQSRGGSYVRTVTRAQLKDLFDVRELLECEAVRRAVELSVSGDLQGQFDQMMRAALDADPAALFRADLAFHAEIFDMSASPALADAARPLLVRLGTFVNATKFVEYPDCVQTAETHRPILEAMRAGDAALAQQRVREHLAGGWQSVEKWIKD